MKKSERLLQLLRLLRGRRRAVTAQSLAERLQVSERTIYRDIESLVLSGVSIEGEAGVGYSLRPDSDILPLMFDAREIEALMLSVRLMKAWSDDELIEAATRAQDKIKAALPARMQQELERKHTKFLVPDYKREYFLQHSEDIRAAIDAKQVLRIAYQDEQARVSTRAIECLGLMFWGSAWTVVAWCQLRDDYRLFRLDRIQSLESLEQYFQIENEKSFARWVGRFEKDVSTGFWD